MLKAALCTRCSTDNQSLASIEELARQKAEIEARLAGFPAVLPDVHPNIAEHYRAKVTHLADTQAEPESNGEAREDIRSLVGEVVINPAISGARAMPPYAANRWLFSILWQAVGGPLDLKLQQSRLQVPATESLDRQT